METKTRSALYVHSFFMLVHLQSDDGRVSRSSLGFSQSYIHVLLWVNSSDLVDLLTGEY